MSIHESSKRWAIIECETWARFLENFTHHSMGYVGLSSTCPTKEKKT